MSEILTDAWRRAHVEMGDRAMDEAHETLDTHAANGLGPHSIAAINLYLSIAQAHYLAANVRARPSLVTEVHKHD